MKRKLITKLEEHYTIVCDNHKCDFSIHYLDHGLKIEDFINIPCPICGENLLTSKDYLDYLRLMKLVNFINKWFSWITIFYSKKTLQNISKASVKVHNGLDIKKID